MKFEGKRALVTGATSGIGRATAETLAGEGATVFLSGRDPARGAEVAAEIERAGGKAEFIAADLSKPSEVAQLADRVGEIDILVNNAGVFPGGATDDIDEATFDTTFDVNVKAPFFLTAAIAPRMAERGTGVVINITTMVAEFGMAGLSLYGASKAAAALLTKAWAAEYGPRGVRVNAVSPGPTRTPGTAAMGDGFEQITATIPLGRAADPAEIAAAISFLASEDARYLNGAIVPVDGGRVAV